MSGICPDLCPKYVRICPKYVRIMSEYVRICPNYVRIMSEYVRICPNMSRLCDRMSGLCPPMSELCPVDVRNLTSQRLLGEVEISNQNLGYFVTKLIFLAWVHRSPGRNILARTPAPMRGITHLSISFVPSTEGLLHINIYNSKSSSYTSVCHIQLVAFH